MDPRKVERLGAATDEMFTAFPTAIKRSEEMIEELRVIGRSEYSTWLSRRFGKDGFIRLKNPFTQPNSNSSANSV